MLEGLRGEDSIAELCRGEGISSSMYYGWSKEFLKLASAAWRATLPGWPRRMRSGTCVARPAL